jgi:hypothetical protein
MFSAQAACTLTNTGHEDTKQSTIEAPIRLDDVTPTDPLIRWSPNEWPSVCREVPVSADRMFWTSNTPAKWTLCIHIYIRQPTNPINVLLFGSIFTVYIIKIIIGGPYQIAIILYVKTIRTQEQITRKLYCMVYIKERSHTISPCGIWDVKARTLFYFVSEWWRSKFAQNASNYDYRPRYRLNIQARRTGNDDIVVYF